jgi:hypothetical protein
MKTSMFFYRNDRNTAETCHEVSRIDGVCWHEFIHASIHTPLLEFETHLFNAIMNLGVNPQVSVPLVELQGFQTNNSPVYPNYVDSEVKEILKLHSLDFDTIVNEL